MNIYTFKCWNKNGFPIGQYHVVASGVNKAKAALRANRATKGWLGKIEVINTEKAIIGL